MATTSAEVVVVGGGIAGLGTAYFLGKSGVKCVVVERDSVGSHASGFAYGGLSPLGGVGIPGPVDSLAKEGFRLHQELAETLPAETGVDTEFRIRPTLGLAFTEDEAEQIQYAVEWQRQQGSFDVRWIDGPALKSIDLRISPEALGGALAEGMAEVEPYRFVLALAQAAEKTGAIIHSGTAKGLKKDGARVSAVVLDNGEIPCEQVVLATGPWSGECSSWLGTPIDVRPLKGQIIRLRDPGPPFQVSIGWSKNYATTKPDGLLWAGTTEEEAGFDARTTTEARDDIMGSLLKMAPSLDQAQLVQQTACLRPVSADGLPVLGQVPNWEGVFMVTGAGRKGILLGPSMARITADLVTKRSPDIPIDAFDPGRFAGKERGPQPKRPSSTFLPGA